MNRQSYYNLVPLPVQRHSVINSDAHQTQLTGRAISDEDIEMTDYTTKGAGVHETVYNRADPFGMSYNSTYRPYQGYDKPLLDDPYRSAPPPPQQHKQQHHHHRDPPSLWQRAVKFPIFTYVLTIVDVAIFIWELIKMKQLTGSAFQTKPYFNPMLGPSSYAQIYLGSRFTPCAMSSQYVDLNYIWPCPNSTSTDTDVCSLAELCGFAEGTDPSQIWRIVSACFMHAGFVHIIFNMLLQLTMAREVEIEIGSIRYLVIYLLSGISGNLFGLNFAGDGLSSTGASGALFGIIAVNLVIYILHKDKTRMRGYKLILGVLIGEIIVCLVLGLLPGLDNFAHIGGFVCGLLMSFILLDNPRFVKEKPSKRMPLFKSHKNYKRKQFLIWSAVRVVSVGLLVAWFVGLGINIKNGGGNCSWCKYLSCIPVNDWCSSSDLTTG